jgi:short-subunit dehydrogenase
MIWKNAIIVGASSGIGAEIARQMSAQGCRVALVARREAELKRISSELAAAGTPAGNVMIYPHDVTCYEEVPGLFQKITRDLGGLDILIYTAGVMPPIAEDEYSFDKDLMIIEVNTLGAIAWMNEAALRFGAAKSGTIVGISSVAGDRGRQGQPAYCASKSALNTYLESLRNRLGKKGVHVVTVKPGPVDTPMTKGLDKLPMMVSASEAAKSILNAADAHKGEVYVPGKWKPVMFIIRNIPSFLFRKLKI